MENDEKTKRERPINAMRRRKLAQLLVEAGGPKKLAAMSGSVDTHLTTVKNGRKDVGDALATKLEQACGKPFGWMDSDPADVPSIDQLSSRESMLIGSYRAFARRASSHELEQLQTLLSDVAAVPDGLIEAALRGAVGGIATALTKAKQTAATKVGGAQPNPSHRPGPEKAPTGAHSPTSRRTAR
jgi:hypothetical protein